MRDGKGPGEEVEGALDVKARVALKVPHFEAVARVALPCRLELEGLHGLLR